MNTLLICIVAFLIVLALFDLVVGVSNDAVNFLNSAIGAKVARFRTVVAVAAVGVFAGAAMSNGMMDVARHGIMTPQFFTIYEVMCIFLAVMVTDVILLDVFNTLGMPTSTTVSMVFELLGGTMALALMKLAQGATDPSGMVLTLGDMVNSEKALSVILAIFVSVAIAFVVGSLVMWLARLVFTFTYRVNGVTTDYTGNMGGRFSSSVKIGIFSGIATTSIIWFLLINGLKGTKLMTPEVKDMINGNAAVILLAGVVLFSVIMTVLSAVKAPVLKFVVLFGTFALAMAFAGNDLVNFVGVPLTGLDAYQDYMAHGTGDVDTFFMSSLMNTAQTPQIYLMAAGVVMVLALIFSKKAQNVVKTSVDLSRQDEGDEMFGSNAAARTIVRHSRKTATVLTAVMPVKARSWVDSRFNPEGAVLPEGAAFDLIRAAVNLVIAGLLVAIGTSFKLPLSTTYVTFMVAMGSSLADRAWSRESAVFRITGVLSVIGGWFITAGVAFIFCMVVTFALYYGGAVAMVLAMALAVFLVIRSNISYAKKKHDDSIDNTFQRIIRSRDKEEAWNLLCKHVMKNDGAQVSFIIDAYERTTSAFFNEEYRQLKRVSAQIGEQQKELKRQRRREIIALRRIDPMQAVERNTWYFLSNNSVEQMLYCMKRMTEPCREHIGNNFTPLDSNYVMSFTAFRDQVLKLYMRTETMIQDGDLSAAEVIRNDSQTLQATLSAYRKSIMDDIQRKQVNVETMTVFLSMIQESQELLGVMRHMIRGLVKFTE